MTKIRIQAIAALCSLSMLSAHAEESSPIKGTWRVDFTALSGTQMAAMLALSDAGGTWRTLAQSTAQGRNPCFGREFPVSVAGDAAAGYTLEVNASGTMAGCTDIKLVLAVVDADQLAARFADGRVIKISRQ